MKNNFYRTVAFILSLSLIFTIAGCGGEGPNLLQEIISESSSLSSSSSSSYRPVLSDVMTSSSSESSESSESSGSSEAEEENKSDSYQNTVKDVQKRMLADTIDFYEKNHDTIGWLYVPGTTIDESVVRNPSTDSKNEYYLRRTNLGVESTGKYSEGWYGCYYTDFRTNIGSRLDLSKNCVIYGHSMTDNPDGVRFAQLNKFENIEFCRTHPYIYFSTIESEMVWQVFAFFYCHIDFIYNVPNPSTESYYQIIEEAKARSFFDFDVPVSVTDKILTLSTCTYNVVDEYPNDYRMVVMAKLLPADAVLQDRVNVTVNTDHLLPDDEAPQFDLYKNASPEALEAARREEEAEDEE